jgi:hypothetical protein
MPPTKQLARHLRGYVATTLLRCEPLRSIELAKRIGAEPRTTKRIIASLREVGAWCREHGLPYWELVTEVRGRERWHRLVDYPAETRSKRAG